MELCHLSDKIKGKGTVWKSSSKVISWLIGTAKKVVKKVEEVLYGDLRSNERTKEEKEADLAKAIDLADQLMTQKDASPETVKAKLPSIKAQYKLTSLTLERDPDGSFYVEAKVNPSIKSAKRDLITVHIDELVKYADPEVASKLKKAIDLSQEKQRKAAEIYKLLRSRLVKRKLPRTKTIAVGENVATISGWNSLKPQWKALIAQQLGLFLKQDALKVRIFVEKHQEEFKQVGYETQNHNFDPKDKPGFHYQSHAEKQALALSSDSVVPSVGVSRNICAEDCYPYLSAFAQIKKQNLVVADPIGVWLFYSNGTVKFAFPKSETE